MSTCSIYEIQETGGGLGVCDNDALGRRWEETHDRHDGEGGTHDGGVHSDGHDGARGHDGVREMRAGVSEVVAVEAATSVQQIGAVVSTLVVIRAGVREQDGGGAGTEAMVSVGEMSV